MDNFIIGRQQILNRESDIYAYELFFRGNNLDVFDKYESTLATNQIITDSILEIGLNNIVGEHKAFVNFTTQNILEKTPLNLPKDRIVIEILENVQVDLRVIYNLREMSQKGYLIALNNCEPSQEYQQLLAFADIIKLDTLTMSEKRIRDIICQLKLYDIKILATKIESNSEYEYLRELGCDYFQGFFFNKPNLISGKRLGLNQFGILRLIILINNPNIEFDELVKEISQNLCLSYKILHYINSAFYPTLIKIKSINQAVAYLGLDELKRWINIVVLSSLSNKPSFVLQTSLIRGKMCELLVRLTIKDTSTYNEFFLIGILSSLDYILDIPIEESLRQLPLNNHIMDAILYRKGLGGEALNCVLNYELGNFDKISFCDLNKSTISKIYIESLCWSTKVCSI